MNYLIRLFLIIFFNFVLFAQNVTTEEKIIINLDSDEQIQQSMDEIRAVNQDDFKYLEQLRVSNDPQFKSMLHNRLYALRQKQKMDALIPKRELGYFEKIKESNQRIKYLSDLYKKITKPEEKIQLEKRLEEAAENRYLIEVEMKQSQIKTVEDLLVSYKKALSNFESKKEKYIKRTIAKAKAHLKK